MLRPAIWLSTIGFAAALLSLATGCASLPASTEDDEDAACKDGETRACYEAVAHTEETTTCRNGEQTCEGGVWSACTGGDLREVSRSRRAGTTPLALSDSPEECDGNACNPACWEFDENPSGPGVTPTYIPGADVPWETGGLEDMPPGLVNKGLSEPCVSGDSCQFDHHCENPSSGSCLHHKCEVGAGLDANCDSCVADICDTKPACCETAYGGSCAHSPCETGNKLKSTCDACVTAICAVDKTCCTGTWDSDCVHMVDTVCGKTCEQGAWTQDCVDAVYDVCGAFCTPNGACKHDKCYVGSALDAACDPCVAEVCAVDPICCGTSTCTHTPCNEGVKLTQACHPCVEDICAVDSYCCNVAWDALCVFEVLTVCQSECPLAEPGWTKECVEKVDSVCGEYCPDIGDCYPWEPDQTDAACAGVDLTVGVPCGEKFPVCNRGNTEVDAGVPIVHFPANSQQYPSCKPDMTHPGATLCSTKEKIPPGQCIEVTDCDGLNGNREIMVNPEGAVAECHCKNNWSLYSKDVECQSQVCSGANTEANIRKVNLFFAVSKAGSMVAPGRWDGIAPALKSFFADPLSGGLGVSLRFWPDDAPAAGCNGIDCSTAACQVAQIPLEDLSDDAAPADDHEAALVAAIDAAVTGGTSPMYPALQGALDAAAAHQAVNPEELSVVVLVMDTDPTACELDVTTIATAANDALVTHGVQTFVLGVDGIASATAQLIADEGGGQAFFVGPGDDAADALVEAMVSIRGTTARCTLPLANIGDFDPLAVQVMYTPSGESPGPLVQYQNEAGCGGVNNPGWYYDDLVAPTEVILCSKTCTEVTNDTEAKVDVLLGCFGTYAETSVTEDYTAICPNNGVPTWSFFEYESVTQSDSKITFEVRVGDNAAGVGAWIPAATAQANPDTQNCTAAGPAGCPIDLYALLGAEASKPYLELRSTLTPSADLQKAPILLHWELSYTCEDAQ